MFEYQSYLKELVARIEDTLDKELPAPKGDGDQLIFDAAQYAVKSGGKRVRPLFLIEAFKVLSPNDEYYGQAYEAANRFAAAIEIIHSYSLAHDDLPAMDNDMLRRGKPTTHAQFGEAIGILAGDALLNLAYELMIDIISKAVVSKNIEIADRCVRAAKVISYKSGIYGMVRGQATDVGAQGSSLTVAELTQMYGDKTGALIEAAMMAGAIMAGASAENVKRVEKLSSKIGLAFQIQDDILDITGHQHETGKRTLRDMKNNKLTFVDICSLKDASGIVKDLSVSAQQELTKLMGANVDTDDGKFLIQLIQNLVTRKK
jgi:geranylgeranyl diphosphate synthase type II